MLAWREFGEHLSEVLAPPVRNFAPEAVVLGGNLSRAWRWFAAPLRARFGDLAGPSALLDQAALLGAALHALTAEGARESEVRGAALDSR